MNDLHKKALKVYLTTAIGKGAKFFVHKPSELKRLDFSATDLSEDDKVLEHLKQLEENGCTFYVRYKDKELQKVSFALATKRSQNQN